MTSISLAWHATAAYLYVLHLDAAGLAWEYLRRNPGYQRAWRRWLRSGRGSARVWGLEAFVDPAFDAATVVPPWDGRRAIAVHVVHGTRLLGKRDERSLLWGRTGDTLMTGCAERLLVSLFRGSVTLSYYPNAEAFPPLAFVIPVGADAAMQWRAAARANALLLDGQPRGRLSRLQRHRLADLRGLQALDGLVAGASQREIGRVLFGPDVVTAAWSSDGELRALTRYVIRRAWHFAHAAGYLRLLGCRGRTSAHAVSP